MPNIQQFKSKKEYLNWYREYRKKRREELRKYNRKYNKVWRERNPERHYKLQAEIRKRFPEKYHARKLLMYAVKIGNIKRGRCEICKKPNAQGHHEDYNKPLDVRWFCHLHHAEFHSTKKDIPTIHRSKFACSV